MSTQADGIARTLGRGRRWIGLAGGLAVTLLASASSIATEHEAYFPLRPGGVLATPVQVDRDRLAVRIYNSPAVRRAQRDLEAIYAADPTANLPDARSTLQRAAAATAMGGAAAVVNKDTDRPTIYWSTTAPHRLGDLRVPLIGLMVDDPDNVYRTVAIDGAAAYEIHGKVTAGAKPSQEMFILHEEHSGEDPKAKIRNIQTEEGAVALHDLELGPDGSFTITIDSSPVAGRKNHLQTHTDARTASILIRDTLGDWAHDNPTRLEVRRISGPPLRPPRTEAELTAQAAALTTSVGAYWLAWAHKVFYDRPVNTVTHDNARVSGWGRASCGHYRLAADEALVVHLERRGAAYLGFQLSDAWGQGQAYDYIARTGSLNGSQARPNADGTYTYVVANSDPGVLNWLDPIGSSAGTFCIRWQKMAAGEDAAGAVKSMTVVKTRDLKAVLPAETAWVTPAQRAQQLRERRADYMRRLTL